MSSRTKTILDSATATGSWMLWPYDGYAQCLVRADTWNGATVTLQVRGAEETAIDVGTDGVFTDDGGCTVLLHEGCYVRGEVTVATPTDVDMTLTPIRLAVGS